MIGVLFYKTEALSTSVQYALLGTTSVDTLVLLGGLVQGC